MGKHDRHELPNKKRLKKAFYKLSDGEEVLNREQFRQLCYKFYLSPTNRAVNELFEALDKNDDDQLTLDECEELIKKQWKPLDDRMDDFLSDLKKCRAGKEGPIALDELRVILTQDGDEALEEGEIEEIFKMLDVNKDNQIQEAELANAIFHIEKILSRAQSRASARGGRRRRKSSGGSSRSGSRRGSSDSGSHHGDKHCDVEEPGEVIQNDPEPEIVPQTNVETQEAEMTQETTAEETQQETEVQEEEKTPEETPAENTKQAQEDTNKPEQTKDEEKEPEISQEKAEKSEIKAEEGGNTDTQQNSDESEKTQESEKKEDPEKKEDTEKKEESEKQEEL